MLLGAALNPQMTESLTRQIQAYASAGFDYIDLALDYPAVPSRLDTDSLRDCLKETGLPLHGQTPAHLPSGSPYADVRHAAIRAANEAVGFLENLGAKTVVLHPDGDYGFVPDEMMAWNAGCLNAVASQARHTQLLLENLPHGPFTHVEKMLELIQATHLEKKVQLNVDVGHVSVGQHQGGSPLEDFLKTSLVRHVHASDNDGEADQHLPLGKGKIDWTQVKRKLEKAGVTEVTIECYSGGIQGVLESKKMWEKT